MADPRAHIVGNPNMPESFGIGKKRGWNKLDICMWISSRTAWGAREMGVAAGKIKPYEYTNGSGLSKV